MSEAKHHTVFASQAVGLAELFKWTVGKSKLDGPVAYTAEMSTPDGPSTAGGKQALQHLSLVPEGGGPKLVIGSAHLVDKQAELRTFAHVDEIHRQRFKGASPPFDKARYDGLADQIRKFFAEKGFVVTMVDVAPSARSGAVPAAGRQPVIGGSPLRTVLVVALAVVIGAITMMVLDR